MSYLNEFHKRVEAKDFMGFLQLWEEYCTCDEVDSTELKKILDLIYESEFCEAFGNYSESILPLWKSIEHTPAGDTVFERIYDIQTTNSPILAELALDFLKKNYSKDKTFNEKIRLIGLRNKSHFRGAISNFKLLNHLVEGSFVFHTAGWGAGEVISVSLIREELAIEFENVLGKKQVSFENAFKTLRPLANDHFLAMRFGNPDALEILAKQDCVKIIKKLLEDLGPKTASEIKDEVADLIIPKKDWPSWWQLVRSKLKKESSIEIPTSLNQPFRIREQEVSPAERFNEQIKNFKSIDDQIILCYNFIRDFSEYLRSPIHMKLLEATLNEMINDHLPSQGQRFELLCLGLETSFKSKYEKEIIALINSIEEPIALLPQIPILALQKKFFILLATHKANWPALFAGLLLVIDQALLRDYLFKELLLHSKSMLDQQIEFVLEHPKEYAEFLLWLLAKQIQDPQLTYSDKKMVCRISEAYLTALHAIEFVPTYTNLSKKMCNFLTAKRFNVVRQIMDKSDSQFLQEFLLLASKCQCFTQQDNKILASLAVVACPDLKTVISNDDDEQILEKVIWTTEAGLNKIREKFDHLSTTEMLDIAREIEVARSHGDLRENSEYKFALERRTRIQTEIKALSKLLENAKLISKKDLDLSKVSIGTCITLESDQGEKLTYSILGPWDADAENGIISFQSKLALSLLDKQTSDKVNLQGANFMILEITSAL
jgi:transcription elongation factor GreA